MFGCSFHHIGIACADIDAAAAFVHRTFDVQTDSGTVHDPLQNASLRLFNEGTPGAIELVAGPVVSKLLERKVSYYHICYETRDINATLASAAEAGALRVSGPTPAVLFGGRRVAFVWTGLGLIEFLEGR